MAWFGKGQDRPCKNRQISITESHRRFVTFNMSELRSFRNLLNFDAVSILKHVADKAHFYSLYSVVTLKFRSRLPKSDQIFKTIPLLQ